MVRADISHRGILSLLGGDNPFVSETPTQRAHLPHKLRGPRQPNDIRRLFHPGFIASSPSSSFRRLRGRGGFLGAASPRTRPREQARQAVLPVKALAAGKDLVASATSIRAAPKALGLSLRPSNISCKLLVLPACKPFCSKRLRGEHQDDISLFGADVIGK